MKGLILLGLVVAAASADEIDPLEAKFASPSLSANTSMLANSSLPTFSSQSEFASTSVSFAGSNAFGSGSASSNVDTTILDEEDTSDSAASNSTDNVMVGDSESGSNGSVEIIIESDKSTDSEFSSSESATGVPPFNSYTDSSSGPSYNSSSSSEAVSIQLATLQASTFIVVAISVLM
ncbi:hypothetical protein CCR75_005966 [Bremia lactucae]|uniref:Secreted protein n=1 Tax=Bremia lactucae TaxID=4779 RepID=A0A976ID88_BRELC|nr:hypothetical protein CCR75_005966 [Bremia lactucae]